MKTNYTYVIEYRAGIWYVGDSHSACVYAVVPSGYTIAYAYEDSKFA